MLAARNDISQSTGAIDLNRWGIWLVAVAGCILATGTLLNPVDGHSFYLNTNWHAGFLAELRAGTWYPRWISTTNQGLGAPSFYFYAPLPFYVSALVDVLWPFAHAPEFAPVTTAAIAIIFSGLAMHALLKTLHGAAVAVPVAILFMAMPYHFGVDFWWRAAFGELWAFVWLPLMLLGVVWQVKSKTGGTALTAGASAAMILSHLPSFVIGACGLAVAATCALAVTFGSGDERRMVLRVILKSSAAILLALLLTATYWYPALTTTEHTVMSAYMTQGWYDYRNNFLFTVLRIPENQVIQTIALGVLATGLLAIIFIVMSRRYQPAMLAMSCAAFLVSMFMMMPHAAWLYEILPPLQRLQFPWRFLILGEIVLAMLLAQALAAAGLTSDATASKPAGRLAMIIAGTAIVTSAFIAPLWMRPTYTYPEAERVSAYLATRADGDEYRTRGTDLSFYTAITFGRTTAPAAPRFSDESRDALLSGIRASAGQMIFNRYWYPDFMVIDRMSGRELVTTAQATTGLAVVDIPAGPYDIVLGRRTLPNVQIGYFVSLAGLFFGLIWTVFRFRKRRVA